MGGGGPQHLGRLLGGDVVDEHPGPGLAGGEVLELGRRPADRERLQVGVGQVAVAPDRRLVTDEHVGQGLGEEGVEAAQDVLEEGGQAVALGVVQGRQVGQVAGREQVDLERPAGGEGHEGHPARGPGHQPLPVGLGGHDRAAAALARGLPMGPGHVQLAGRARGHERVGVDLAVGMVEGDADLLAPVLEREDLLDPVHGPQLQGPVRPDLDHGAQAPHRQPGQGPVVVGGEADDLAAAHPRLAGEGGGGGHLARVGGQRREAVLEHDHVVVGGRDLGRPAAPGRAQRALVGRGQVGAALAVGGDDYPLLGQGVAADLAGGGGHAQVAGVGVGAVDTLVLVEVDELAAVGQADGGPGQLHDAAPSAGGRSGSTTRVRRPASARAARVAGSAPLSVTSSSSSSQPAKVASETCPSLLESATTTTRRAPATITRLVSASAMLGVVSPTRASMECTPSTSRSTLSWRRVWLANGPTRASDGVRNEPPETTTECQPLASRAPATFSELVTKVRSRTTPPRSRWATCQVVVPADRATVMPSATMATAASAMAALAAALMRRLVAKWGSAAPPLASTAPPWTFSTSCWPASTPRSRRMVISETPRPSARSATVAAPDGSMARRMASRRSCASTIGLLGPKPYRTHPTPNRLYQRSCVNLFDRSRDRLR